MAGQGPLSEDICRRQMEFMGHLARRADSDPLRCSIFCPGGIELKRPDGPRQRGRPRQTWSHM
eukprot:261828-Pyramimonas_sp.AAC.1